MAAGLHDSARSPSVRSTAAALSTGTSEDDLDVVALGPLDGLEHADRHVVIGRPHGIDPLEAGER